MNELIAHRWSSLNRLQLGRYAEYFFKMQFVLAGFDVYGAEVDDRGIDFVLRREPGVYWDVQVKSVRDDNYVFFKKSQFRIRPNLLAALALFNDDAEPALYLISSMEWNSPAGCFVSRDYEGRSSAPEYGINLSRAARAQLEPFRFTKALDRIFGDDLAKAP
jgi:hypothetical protein